MGRSTGRANSPHARLLRLALLALVLLIPSAAGVSAHSLCNEGDEIVGTITNGTPGGEVAESLTVTLHTFAGTRETDAYTTTVGADGEFRLQNLDLRDEETAVVRTVYQGVTYLSEFVTVSDEEGPISLPVRIYETTTDTTQIEIIQLHVFAEQIGNRVRLQQVAILRNGGNKTYVGRQVGEIRATWSMVLPHHMEDLRFEHSESDQRFLLLGNGFADSRPIPPGDASVECAFSYELPVEGDMRIEQTADLPLRAAVVVLPGDGWKLKSDRLNERDTLDTETGRFLPYAGGPWDAGEPLVFTLATEKGANVPVPEAGLTWHIMIGVAAVMVAAVAVLAMWRGPSPAQVPSQAREEIEALAALEMDYAVKQLSWESYQERREALKEEVRRKLSRDRRDRA